MLPLAARGAGEHVDRAGPQVDLGGLVGNEPRTVPDVRTRIVGRDLLDRIHRRLVVHAVGLVSVIALNPFLAPYVVEGRNDVVNLLKCGIKNAIAVEGTNVPEEIKELTKEKTTTVFVDAPAAFVVVDGLVNGQAYDVTVVAVDSTEPDLDHGVIGRGRYGWIEERFASQDAFLRIFVLHHHLLPVPGTGRERNVVHDAGDTLECLQRADAHLVLSGHKHVPFFWGLNGMLICNSSTASAGVTSWAKAAPGNRSEPP